MALSARQHHVLQVLAAGPLVVDELLRRALPEVPRRQALETLYRLVNGGLIALDGKQHLREVAGAMVWLLAVPAAAVSRGAIGRKFVAEACGVSH